MTKAGMRKAIYVFHQTKCGLATGNNIHKFQILLSNGKSTNAILSLWLFGAVSCR